VAIRSSSQSRYSTLAPMASPVNVRPMRSPGAVPVARSMNPVNPVAFFAREKNASLTTHAVPAAVGTFSQTSPFFSPGGTSSSAPAGSRLPSASTVANRPFSFLPSRRAATSDAPTTASG
jgi:hypothetical protein